MICSGCSRPLLPSDRRPCPMCRQGRLCWDCVLCRGCEEDLEEAILWALWWWWIWSRYGGC